MTFEVSKFGAPGVNVVKNVHNQFGPRETGQTQGTANTAGFGNELTVDITGSDLTALAYPLDAPVLPAGAVITKVFLEVTEAFALGGTTPTIEVGTETSEATNGFSITEAQAEATGVTDLTSALSGTWAAGLAASTTLGLFDGRLLANLNHCW